MVVRIVHIGNETLESWETKGRAFSQSNVKLWAILGFFEKYSNLKSTGSVYFPECLPVPGQLYTTHLLSLDALLTVIDSTEAHCQAKVLNNLIQQERKEAARPGYEAVDGTREANNSESEFLSLRIPDLCLSLLYSLNPFSYTSHYFL